MLKGIIFDLDGVITDTAEFHYLSWKKLSDEEGFAFDRMLNEKLKGVSRKKSLEILLKENNIQLSEEKTTDCLERKNKYYRSFLNQITEKDFLPGVKDFLQELTNADIKIGLGSASKNAVTVLEN